MQYFLRSHTDNIKKNTLEWLRTEGSGWNRQQLLRKILSNFLAVDARN